MAKKDFPSHKGKDGVRPPFWLVIAAVFVGRPVAAYNLVKVRSDG